MLHLRLSPLFLIIAAAPLLRRQRLLLAAIADFH